MPSLTIVLPAAIAAPRSAQIIDCEALQAPEPAKEAELTP
jgi:hypothetical protein